jgi:hypothetical protein
MSDVFCKQCGVTDDQQAKTKMLIDDLTRNRRSRRSLWAKHVRSGCG